jgi:hypothetical protein
MRTLPERFWKKVDKNGPVSVHRPDLGPCWLWLGALSDGYGLWWENKKNRTAHVSTYEALIGPVRKGHQLDHLCRVRNCCNPVHVEPVTCRENLLRGRTHAASNLAKTHCKYGHAFDESNTRIWVRPDGGQSRVCKTCELEAVRKRRADIRREAG